MKIHYKVICLIIACFFTGKMLSQSGESETKHHLRFSGQLSAWGQYTPDISTKFWLGGRYIPQLNYEIYLPKENLIDFELSANLFGDIGIPSFNDIDVDGKIKPYRAWARYSRSQFEIRLGLQKINFGSAQMFRPLMWFDTMDARDPLQLTDGVWGGLFRYYFQNNANIWFWTLYGNDDNKGWEVIPTSQSIPEIGGRAQFPLSRGEIALSYHFRESDFSKGQFATILPYDKIPENRFGFDIRLDRVIGLWLEGSWTHLSKNAGDFTNQEMFTLGGDYTFGVGNGLAVTFEQLLYSYDEKAFSFDNAATFSGLMLSYPVTIFDDVSAVFYYDWKNSDIYSFLNWKHQWNNIALHGMFYWNPKNTVLPGQMGNDRFYGKGVQVMVVWNH